jgi:hypothetical protein
VYSKVAAEHIPIIFDTDRCLKTPAICMNDGHKTKAVQSMLREYCTAHIHEIYLYLWERLTKSFELGFITSKKKQVIPWGALVKDPSSWISAECVPDGFVWKDPSKIQIGEVFIPIVLSLVQPKGTRPCPIDMGAHMSTSLRC